VEVQPQRPTVKGPAETFTGDVWVDMIALSEPPSRMRVGIVRLSLGTHTAWHRHGNGPTPHVIDGRGLVHCRNGQLLQVGPGDTIYTPSKGVALAWCGPDHIMTHLVISEDLAEGAGSGHRVWRRPPHRRRVPPP
jgi:quercetin dioxygenase-like cupin family protein